jgi:hypothetical protein
VAEFLLSYPSSIFLSRDFTVRGADIPFKGRGENGLEYFPKFGYGDFPNVEPEKIPLQGGVL